MKEYPRVYENISREPSQKHLAGIGSTFDSVEEYAEKFRTFLKEVHLTIFDFVVKQVWLEQQFRYKGLRRGLRQGNGYGIDWTFSYFIRNIVGITQKPITTGTVLFSIPTYFNDFFPNFSDHNPFEEPEYFKYPYKNVTLDHMLFVYKHDDRIEMLEKAERENMSFNDFLNWAANHALSCMDKDGYPMYIINRHSYAPYIKKRKK